MAADLWEGLGDPVQKQKATDDPWEGLGTPVQKQASDGEEFSRANRVRNATPSELARVHATNQLESNKKAQEASALGIISQFMKGVNEFAFNQLPEQTVNFANEATSALFHNVAPTSAEDVVAAPNFVGKMFTEAPGALVQGTKELANAETPYDIGNKAASLGANAYMTGKLFEPVVKAVPTGAAKVAGKVALHAAPAVLGEALGMHYGAPHGVGAILGHVLKDTVKKEVLKKTMGKWTEKASLEKQKAFERAYTSPKAEEFPEGSVQEITPQKPAVSDLQDEVRDVQPPIKTTSGELPPPDALATFQTDLTPEQQRAYSANVKWNMAKSGRGLENVNPSRPTLDSPEISSLVSDITKDKADHLSSPEFSQYVKDKGGIVVSDKLPNIRVAFVDNPIYSKMEKATGHNDTLGLHLTPVEIPGQRNPIKALNAANLTKPFAADKPLVIIRTDTDSFFSNFKENLPADRKLPENLPQVSDTLIHELGHNSRFEAMKKYFEDNNVALSTNWMNTKQFGEAYPDSAPALNQALRTKIGPNPKKPYYGPLERAEEVYVDLLAGRGDQMGLSKPEALQLLTHMTDYIEKKFSPEVADRMVKEGMVGMRGVGRPDILLEAGSKGKPTSRQSMEQGMGEPALIKSTHRALETQINKPDFGATLEPNSMQHQTYKKGFQVGGVAGPETAIDIARWKTGGLMALREFRNWAKELKGDLGLWREGDKIIFDVSKNYKTLDEALKAAKEMKQRTIWDWENKKVIPVPETVAADYAKSKSREFQPHEPVNVDVAAAKERADLHEAAVHSPNDPEVKKSYDAFKRDTLEQWNALKGHGLQMEPWTQEGQPYKNSKEMVEDVKKGHLYFFTGGDFPKDHPMSDLVPGENGLTYTDIFRAVHDVMGHSNRGFEFGPKGEENAWMEHRKLYSPEARPALAAETRLQNSYNNYGSPYRNEKGDIIKKGEPGYIPVAERTFAEQKAYNAPASQADVFQPGLFENVPEVKYEDYYDKKPASWYDAAEKVIDDIAQKTGVSREKVAGVMAALSPGNEWGQNIKDTTKWAEAYAKKGNVKGLVAQTHPDGMKKAARILQGEDPYSTLGKMKTSEFYKAMLGDKNAAVVDFHMTNWLLGHGYQSLKATEKYVPGHPQQYKRAAEALRDAAKQAGMPVRDFQEAVWEVHREGRPDRAIRGAPRAYQEAKYGKQLSHPEYEKWQESMRNPTGPNPWNAPKKEVKGKPTARKPAKKPDIKKPADWDLPS